MNPKLKTALKSAHDRAGEMFPSLKTDFIRRVNRNAALSNALRRVAGMDEIDDVIEEEPIGFIKAARQDAARLAHTTVSQSARAIVNTSIVRKRVLPVLDHAPRLRACLKRIVFTPAPSQQDEVFEISDVRCLTQRGLMIFGMLTAIQQRGED